MKLSIIIVSYNTKQILDECISSVYSSKIDCPYEIIVVDNNSGDGTVEMLEAKYPGVRIIKNAVNNLFAKANNQAAEIAGGEYLLLLNSDTIVYGDNIQRLVSFMDSLPKQVICCGPKILNPDRTVQSEGFPAGGYMTTIIRGFKLNRFIPFPVNKLLPYGTPVKGNKPRRAYWIAGCCMLIRKSDYLKIGGLNESLTFYGEEPEFGCRSTRMGYKTMYNPQCEIIHLGGASTKLKTAETKDVFEEASGINNYAVLVRETIGYKKGIRRLRLGIIVIRIKRVLSKNKDYFTNMIRHEYKVLACLKKLDAESRH
jgi:GT2 family glycosyltransferase